MKYLVGSLVVLLVVLQQDYWQWDVTSLVYGFLPYSLAYHVGISLGAAVVWWLAVQFCWPRDLDSAADEATSSSERNR